MPSAARIFKLGCALLAGLGLLGGVLLGLAIFFSKPPPPFEERLKALPAAERETLDAVVNAAGLTLQSLRDVGAGARLDDARNYRSVAVERGHVRQLSLQETALTALPSLSAFTDLEQLSLRGCGLTEWPDLAGCRALRVVDLSQGKIEQIAAERLPPSVETIDLSQNPLRNLAALTRLTTAEEIRLRECGLTDFEPLIDLPLRRLDLSKNPIQRLPERLPKSRDFRVDLTDCPVANPPGYLSHWSFTTRQSGVPGGRETKGGLVTMGKFEATGTWEVVPHLVTVELLTAKNNSTSGRGLMHMEVSVTAGRLRVYLTEASESRGEWFAKGYVKGTDSFFHVLATVYADAEPGKPARLDGLLSRFPNQPYYFVVEPQPGEPVKGMSYRAWHE